MNNAKNAKKGKRPRISDDDDPPEPVVAVKRAKCIPFSNEEVQQIKVFMEGHAPVQGIFGVPPTGQND